jgi:quinol monooxygenase YgiN
MTRLSPNQGATAVAVATATPACMAQDLLCERLNGRPRILRMAAAHAAPKVPMTAPLVRMTVRWLVPLGESRPMTTALHTLMVAARAERGCLACSLSTELGDRVALHFVEDWETEEDLQRQLRSDWFVSFAALIERATSPPDVLFSVAGGIRGLDYVEEVRQQYRSS